MIIIELQCELPLDNQPTSMGRCVIKSKFKKGNLVATIYSQRHPQETNEAYNRRIQLAKSTFLSRIEKDA